LGIYNMGWDYKELQALLSSIQIQRKGQPNKANFLPEEWVRPSLL
jgi:hypothetical protein